MKSSAVFVIICREGADVMANAVNLFIAEVLNKYCEAERKSCVEMAVDFDIAPSNIYKYLNGNGNPTAVTIDKIITGVQEKHPEILERMEPWWR